MTNAHSLHKKIYWWLVITVSALVAIGLLNLYSIFHRGGDTHLFYLQMIWIFLGFFVFFGLSFIPYSVFTRLAYWLYFLNLLMLFCVPFLGSSFGGAKRWLDFGLFHYQPAETTKLVLILLLARILSTKRSWDELSWMTLIKPLFLIALPVFLIVRQPDLGTAMITLIISGSLIVFARVHKSILLSFLALIFLTAPLTWTFGLKEYQKDRILTFFSPDRDPRGSGYNAIQSKIAIGSGLFFGKGFGKGTQSQLEFLPERHTDFIFSVLSEEHGFIGSMVTLFLFLFLIYLGFFESATLARDKEGMFLAVGMSFYLFWHIFINMGMTMGLLPIVGIPLPLLSYGGSSLITTMSALGFISSVYYRRNLF